MIVDIFQSRSMTDKNLKLQPEIKIELLGTAVKNYILSVIFHDTSRGIRNESFQPINTWPKSIQDRK